MTIIIYLNHNVILYRRLLKSRVAPAVLALLSTTSIQKMAPSVSTVLNNHFPGSYKLPLGVINVTMGPQVTSNVHLSPSHFISMPSPAVATAVPQVSHPLASYTNTFSNPQLGKPTINHIPKSARPACSQLLANTQPCISKPFRLTKLVISPFIQSQYHKLA